MDQLKEFFSAIGTTGRILLGLLVCLTGYWLPTGVAIMRDRKNTAAIAMLNTFLGWTLLGWVIALVWAVKAEDTPQQPVTVVVNNHINNQTKS
jgi:fumarate reductase subunit D